MSRRARASVWTGRPGAVRRALVRRGVEVDEASDAAEDSVFAREARRLGVNQALQRRERRKGG